MTTPAAPNDVQHVVEASPNSRYIRYSSILGKGSYKTVYEAFDTEEALQVAWNKLHVDRLSAHDFEKVSNEVSLLRKVTHKNVIKFYDSWSGVDTNGNQTLNFITEQMMSGTLKEYLPKAQVIKLKVIRRWCSNILDAIAYLHAQDPPIMHRDLKCDNIFINGHVGEVKVGDLGLSGVKEREKADSVIGTPEFMAPELYEESYTEKVDIYAFGMCLLEIVSREYPYSECTNMAQIFKKVFGGEKPRAFEMLVDGDVKKVIAACLQREPNRPSAVELLQHPLFSEWETDDGSASNLSLVKTSSQSIQDQQIAQTLPSHIPIGTDLIDWSDPLKRHVLVRMKEGENGNGDEHQVSVRASNHNGGFVMGLEIRIRDAIKRVEFTFDPFQDSPQHIAQEMVSEFSLGTEQLALIQEEVERQVKMANDQRDQREAFSRNATPQPAPRHDEPEQQSHTPVHPSSVTVPLLTPNSISVSTPRNANDQVTPSLSRSQRSEQRADHSFPQQVPPVPDFATKETAPDFPESSPIIQVSGQGTDHSPSHDSGDIPRHHHHSAVQELIARAPQLPPNVFHGGNHTLAGQGDVHIEAQPASKPASLALPPSVNEFNEKQSEVASRKRSGPPEFVVDADTIVQQRLVQHQAIPPKVGQHQAIPPKVGQHQAIPPKVGQHQTIPPKVGQHQTSDRHTPRPVLPQHAVGQHQSDSQDPHQRIAQKSTPAIPERPPFPPSEQPPNQQVVYQGIRGGSFSSRSDQAIPENEKEPASDAGSITSGQAGQPLNNQQSAAATHIQDDQLAARQRLPLETQPNYPSQFPNDQNHSDLVIDSGRVSPADETLAQILPHTSSFVSSRAHSTTSVDIPSTSVSPPVSRDFRAVPVNAIQRALQRQTNKHDDQTQFQDNSNQSTDVREVRLPSECSAGPQNSNPNSNFAARTGGFPTIEIRCIPTESTSDPGLKLCRPGTPTPAHHADTFSFSNQHKTLPGRPVSSPPTDPDFQIASIPQSVSDGHLPLQTPNSGRLEVPNHTSNMSTPRRPAHGDLNEQRPFHRSVIPLSLGGLENDAIPRPQFSIPGEKMKLFSVHSPVLESAAEKYSGGTPVRPYQKSRSRPQIIVVPSEAKKPLRGASDASNLAETGNQDLSKPSTKAYLDQRSTRHPLSVNHLSPERAETGLSSSVHKTPNGHHSVLHINKVPLGSESGEAIEPVSIVTLPPTRTKSDLSRTNLFRGRTNFPDPKNDHEYYTECLKLMDRCARGQYKEVFDNIERDTSIVSFADYDRRTPLHIAAAEGHTHICALLIECGAEVSAKDRWGNSPLSDAEVNYHRDVEDLLRRHGAVDTSRPSDVTSFELMQYAARGDIEPVRNSLVSGAKPTFQDYDRRTPLHLACSEGHVDVAELLLVNGASHSARDRMGRSPVDDAVNNGHLSILRVLRQYGASIPAHLLEAQPEAATQKGIDLMEHAARGRINAVSEYLKQGTNPNFRDFDCRTPLHLACTEGYRDVVMLLLHAGANINVKDRWNSTPLDEARKSGYINIAEDIEKWDTTQTQEVGKVSFNSAIVVNEHDGQSIENMSSETATFDHFSHGIATSVSMGAIPTLQLASDDFAARYGEEQTANGLRDEHAPLVSAPNADFVPTDTFHSSFVMEAATNRDITQQHIETNRDHHDDHSFTGVRAVRGNMSGDSERSFSVSNGGRSARAQPAVQPVESIGLPSVMLPNTNGREGEFRLSYIPNFNGVEQCSHRYSTTAISSEEQKQGGPMSSSRRQVVNTTLFNALNGSPVVNVKANGQVNRAVRLLVDGLIDAAVSDRG